MAGIVSYGACLPAYRIDRKLIGSVWERGAIPAERCVANSDEDSATMGGEAGSNSLAKFDSQEVCGLFFASTTSAYLEKMNSAPIATALDLPREVATADFANSPRAGTSTLSTALPSRRNDSSPNIPVFAADTRQAYPESDEEPIFGEGSAAVLVGGKGAVADLGKRTGLTGDIGRRQC